MRREQNVLQDGYNLIWANANDVPTWGIKIKHLQKKLPVLF